ncbi:hypothetical protein PLESTB_000863500 [Pleodorina starrii]|uniref:Uncharacterized protein n=1 Tax=Pleodorina starrii TaxID=330485 RepID=A0A9W6F3K9_9CHLO|nr:hypothetical protein PLESTB_000863500 [Pleodorina starrii]GLC72091.1 hypothetical protein PLESTF_001202900 [Pleodorina starrii]
MDAWTAEEDARLQALFQEHGSSWSLIAKNISNRTPQQCRGRWCILTSSRSKASTQEAAKAPEPGDVTQGLKGQDAASAGAVELALHGRARPQDCPSTAVRLEAATELPAMPASAIVPTPASGGLPQTAAARSTRAPARVTNTGPTPRDTLRGAGISRRERRPCVLQDPGSAEALAATEKTRAPSQEAAGQEDAAEATSEGASRGRAVSSEPLESAAPEAVDLPPPQDSSKALGQRSNEKPGGAEELHNAADCNGKGGSCLEADSGGARSGPASVRCEADRGVNATAVASTCERPTISTSSRSALVSLNGCSRQRPAGRTEAAPDDVLLDMSTRVTRSGRCYPLGATPAVTTAKLCCPEQPSQGVVSTEAPAEALATTADTQAGCDEGPSQEFAPSVGPSTASAGQRNRSGASASQLPGALDGEAGLPAPDYGLFAAQMPVLDADPTQGNNEPQQATPGVSANTSLSLPEGLFGAVAVTPAGDQPLDWQEVIGSPPTSSFLAFVEAGLLHTPSAVNGPSAGPDLLCAPVPPGMPKVTPGFSNEWSDVPALSWTELQACNGGFGIIGRPPAASAQGTPDNSRPALRPVQDNGCTGITPSRDMYVRPALHGAGAGNTSALPHYTSGCTLRPEAVEPAGEGEGQGDTRSLPPSPSGNAQGARHPGCGACGVGPDGAVRGRNDHYATGETSTAERCQQSLAVAGSTIHAAIGRAVPDFCSPAKQQTAVLSRLPVESLDMSPGSASQPPSANRHCGFTSGGSLVAQLHKLQSAGRAFNGVAMPALSSAPLFPPPMIGGASPHPTIAMPPPFPRPPSVAGQLPLPPSLASALLPVMAPQAQQPLGADVGSSQHRPLGPMPQLPALGAPGARTDGAIYMPATGSYGGVTAPFGALGLASASNGPAGPFPRLTLPKPPVGGTIRSLFPVLSLSGYQSGK